jgi:hypothetical protein
MSRNNPYLNADDVKKIGPLLKTVEGALRRFGAALSPDERRKIAKTKPGTDAILELVVGLARKHGVSAGAMSVDALSATLDGARRVRTVLVACQAIAGLVSDMLLRTEAEAWRGTTMYYSLLLRVAAEDPELRQALQPAMDFFGRRSASVKKDRSLQRADRKLADASEQVARATRHSQALRVRRGETASSAEQGPDVVAPSPAPAANANTGTSTAPADPGIARGGTTNGTTNGTSNGHAS